MNKKMKILVSLLLTIAMLTTVSCGRTTNKTSKTKQKETQEITTSKSETESQKQKKKNTDTQKENKKFKQLEDELFKEVLSQSVLTVNSILDHPENYGITKYEYTLGEVTKEENEKSTALMKKYLDKLEEIDYDSLNDEEKLNYDIMVTDLKESIELSKYYLYSDYLSPLYGIPSALPSYLGQYSLNSSQDVYDYIEVLKLVADYFPKIVEFQKEKNNAGITLPDFEIDEIIDQCNQFISDSEHHFLISSFDEKIDDISDLSSTEKENYKNENADLIKNKVIPAYQKLISDMTQFKGTETKAGGLCKYDDGKEYYEKLFRSETGSPKSVEDTKKLFEKQKKQHIKKLQALILKHPDIIDKTESYKAFDDTNPDEILEYLLKTIQDDFPSGYQTKYTIHDVPAALQKYASPASYYIPQIDNLSVNNIFINRDDAYKDMNLYHTLAHEGFPGHMLQTTYFQSTNPHPVRSLFRYDGYIEGWGFYSEFYSYDVSDCDSNISQLYKLSDLIGFNTYCLCDIGVNYEGWSEDDTKDYVKSLGYGDEAGTQIYRTVLENPCAYIKYYLGYLEFMEMRETAEKELGDDFNIKEFHKFILDIGPAQFEIVNDRFDTWLENQK